MRLRLTIGLTACLLCMGCGQKSKSPTKSVTQAPGGGPPENLTPPERRPSTTGGKRAASNPAPRGREFRKLKPVEIDPLKLREALTGEVDADDYSILFKALHHKDAAVREKAIDRLEEFSEDKKVAAKIVAELIEALRDSNDDVRHEAAAALGEFVPYGKTVVPALIRALDGPDFLLAAYAADSLGAFGANAAPAVPALIRLLENEDEYGTHEYAAKTLGLIGPAAKPAIPALLKTANANFFGKKEAAEALGGLGIKNQLLTLARSSNAKERKAAVRALGWVRPTTDEIVGVLGRALTKDKEFDIRSAAAESLSQCDPKLPSAVPYLTAATKDSSRSVRSNSIRALEKFPVDPKQKILTLLPRLKETGGWNLTGSVAARTIGKIGEPAIPILFKIIDDKSIDVGTRGDAIGVLTQYSLKKLLPKPPKRIIALLEDSNRPIEIRAGAAFVLHEMRVQHDQKTATIIAAAQSKSALRVRTHSLTYLGRIDSPPAMKVVIASLDDPDEKVRGHVASILRKKSNPAAVPALIRHLKDPKGLISARCAEGLGKIGKDAKNAIPALLEALKVKNYLLRRTAVTALPRVGGTSPEVVQAILPLLRDFGNTQAPAAEALSEIGPNAKAAIPTLTAILLSKSERAVFPFDKTRAKLYYVFGDIGADAESAVPMLLRAMDDPNESAKHAAIWSLGLIRKSPKTVVPRLISELKGDNKDSAVVALGRFGEASKDAVPQIIKIAKEETRNVQRRYAIEALGEIGPTAVAAVPVLIEALDDDSRFTSEAAAAALKAIAPRDKRVLKVFASWLTVAPYQRELIGELRKKDKNALAVLQTALQHTDAEVKQAAVELAGNLSDVKFARSSLKIALKDKDPAVRSVAAVYLYERGFLKNVQPLVPVLIDGLQSKTQNWRVESTLSRLGRRAIPALAAALADEKKPATVRMAAARMLGRMGQSARRAAPSMQKALKTSDLKLRITVAQMLNRIQPDGSTLAILLEGLKHKDVEIRRLAAAALSAYSQALNKNAEMTIPLMFAALGDSDVQVRQYIGNVFYRLKIGLKQLPAVTKLLKRVQTRSVGFRLLGGIASKSPAAMKLLVGAAVDKDKDVRSEANRVLLDLDEEVIAPMISLLKDDKTPADSLIVAMIIVSSRTGKQKSAVPAIKPLRKHSDASVKRWAVLSLASLGEFDATMLPSIIQSLTSSDEDESEVSTAVAVLRKWGPRAKAAAPELLKLLKHSEYQVRRRAADLLPNVGGDSLQAAKALFAAGNAEKSRSYQRSSLHSPLARLGKRAVPFLMKTIAGDNQNHRVAAIEILTRMVNTDNTPRSAIPVNALKPLLNDKNTEIVRASASLLLHLDVERDAVVRTLIEALKHDVEDTDEENTYEILSLLARLGPHAKPAVPALIELIEADPSESDSAADVLQAIGPAAAAAVPVLVKSLAGESPENSINALGAIGPKAGIAVPALIDFLHHPRLRLSSATALGKIGPAAKPAMDILVKQLDDEFDRYDAVAAIARTGGLAESAVPRLAQALKDNDEDMRVACARALGDLGATAKSAVPQLIAALDDKTIRISAARSLGEIGPDSAAAVPRLIKLMQAAGEPERLRDASALALGRTKDTRAVPVLIAALKEKSLQSSAAAGLGEMGAGAKAAVPALVELLKSRPVPYQAVIALGKIGPDAKPAVPVLLKILTQESPLPRYTRRVITEAMGKIDPQAVRKAGLNSPGQ